MLPKNAPAKITRGKLTQRLKGDSQKGFKTVADRAAARSSSAMQNFQWMGALTADTTLCARISSDLMSVAQVVNAPQQNVGDM